EPGAGADAELAVDVAEVELDRLDGHELGARDLTIALAARRRLRDAVLAGAQQPDPLIGWQDLTRCRHARRDGAGLQRQGASPLAHRVVERLARVPTRLLPLTLLEAHLGEAELGLRPLMKTGVDQFERTPVELLGRLGLLVEARGCDEQPRPPVAVERRRGHRNGLAQQLTGAFEIAARRVGLGQWQAPVFAEHWQRARLGHDLALREGDRLIRG